MTDYEEYVYEDEKLDWESDMARDSREDDYSGYEESANYRIHFDVDIETMEDFHRYSDRLDDEIKALRQKFYDLIDNAIGDVLSEPEFKVTDDDTKFYFKFVRR